MSESASECMRVWALIDGFNWYYAIRDAERKGFCSASRRWLDYRAMAEAVVTNHCGPSRVEVVRWYTAYVRNDQPAVDRHRWYQRALEARRTETVLGNYKKKQAWCGVCHRKYPSWEEKATDVNMAIDIVTGAAQDEYDVLFLFSADSDLAPAVLRARQIWKKKVNVVVPAWRTNMRGRTSKHDELTEKSDELIRLTATQLLPELPESVPLTNGKTARRPTSWR